MRPLRVWIVLLFAGLLGLSGVERLKELTELAGAAIQ